MLDPFLLKCLSLNKYCLFFSSDNIPNGLSDFQKYLSLDGFTLKANQDKTKDL